MVGNKLVTYQEWKKDGRSSDKVELYHQLVGQDLAERMILRWDRA